MGLLGNYSVLEKTPGRWLSGGATGQGMYRTSFGHINAARNFYTSVAADKTSAHPVGYTPGSAIVMAQRAGGMKADRTADILLTNAVLNLAAGINIAGSTTVTLTNDNAVLQLIVSAAGTVTITLTPTGTLAGALDASGTTTITLTTGSVTLGALVDAVGAALISLSATATPYAIGSLAGDITPYTTLSPESLANAVWSALAADNDDAGTMGALLNASGAAGDPWSVTLEGSYTAADLLRIVSSVLAGKVSGMESNAPVFRSVDDAEDRVSAMTTTDGNRTAVTLNGA